jgi:hypothetical protein
MRFGTGTPFGQNAFPLHLFSGHTWLVPPGNFQITLGRVCVLQIFDYVTYCWRHFYGPGSRVLVTNSDGSNFRIVNMSGVVTGAAITTAGTSGTNGIGPTQTACSISFGSAPSSGRAATGYVIVGGSINTTVTVTAAGTGYLVPPTIVFDPPPQGGIRATGYAVLSGTTIGSIVVTNAGAGYTSVPLCYAIPQFASYTTSNPPADPAVPTNVFTAPTGYGLSASGINPTLQNMQGDIVGAGSGAVLTVNSTLGGSGTTTGIVITDYGSNYTGTTIPTITFTGGPTSAAATAIMSFSVTSVSVANAGVALSGNASGWTTTSGLVQAHDGNNGYYCIKPANGITTLSSTTTTILTSFTVEDPGFGLQKVPGVIVGAVPGVAPTTNPGGTAVCGGLADTNIIQPGVS